MATLPSVVNGDNDGDWEVRRAPDFPLSNDILLGLIFRGEA